MSLDLEGCNIKYITIHTPKDGGKVDMDIRILKKSPVLIGMITNTGVDLKDADCLKDGLDCPVGTHEALEKINEWVIANHDKPGPSYYNENDKRVLLKDEDNEFMNMPNALLVNVLNVANFYDIDDLMEICTQKIANMVKDKTVEQLRKLFMLPDDLTEDEKADIREKHAWAINGRY